MSVPANHRQNLDQDPFWYKTGVFYEVHVRAFYDADGNGVGDFRGLLEKLDYIKNLGVTAIWLLPFYPSPLKDDGYDIADYRNVHRMYGTLGDFKAFLREAHRHGLRVITELVLNHTSDQHPWFQRARQAKPGSRWRNFYVWSNTPAKYKEARIIFKDVEISNWAWDNEARAYYWHRFFSHQPDLNYDNPEVHEEMIKVVDFWLDLGVDGLRLDAVPYLYEQEGTDCENLPQTHAFLKRLRAHVDQKYGDRMLLAEANQWPEDAAAYFGESRGDEAHMAFHFPLMPRLFMAVRMEDRQPIVDILEQTPPIPATSQWALFLRNHDELTLEMVTDEERDYMYRMYAHMHQARLNLGIRRRLAPLLGNDRRRIELLNALLFSLPGTPVLYYGDEIGLGENIYLGDRNSMRTPMQWSSDKNAGFSRANPQSLYLPIILDPAYHYEANNVEAQLANPHSLLWWMRRLLALRKRWQALGAGRCEFLQPENRAILSYILRYQEETLLVVANLSRFVQAVELDLSAFNQTTPVELFGRQKFPVITERPYFLSLGPHAFYWFSLEPQFAPAQGPHASAAPSQLPALAVEGSWEEVLAENTRPDLEAILPQYLETQPWFGRPAKEIKAVALREAIVVPLAGDNEAVLTFVQADFLEGEPEIYSLPLAFAADAQAEHLRRDFAHLIIAELSVNSPVASQARAPAASASEGEGDGVRGQRGVLYDAVAEPALGRALLELVWHRRRLKGAQGEVETLRTPALRQILGEVPASGPVLAKASRHNSFLVYGDKLILKLFRRLQPGRNPELELGRRLSTQEFPHSPALAGGLEYRGAGDALLTLAVLSAFIPSAKDAQEFTLDALSRYYDRVITWVAQGRSAPPAPTEPIKLLHLDIPAEVAESIGTFLESARLLGARTAELHRALAAPSENADLAPEPFTPHYQRSLFQSMRNLAVQTFRRLRKQFKALPPGLLPLAQQVAELEPVIIEQYSQFTELRLAAQRIRIHGECHLGQILWTGKDFAFIDFEGEPARAVSERRIKRSVLRDVASMVRSFHYAAYAGLEQHVARGSIPPENLPQFESWVRYWNLWVSVAFLRAYCHHLTPCELLPPNEAQLHDMIRVYLLHQVMGELGRELEQHSDHLKVPLQSLLHLLGRQPPPHAPADPPGPVNPSTPQ